MLYSLVYRTHVVNHRQRLRKLMLSLHHNFLWLIFVSCFIRTDLILASCSEEVGVFLKPQSIHLVF